MADGTLYIKLDVDFEDDDKIVEVSAEAELLYIRSLAIAKRLLCDGVLTRSQIRKRCDKLSTPPEQLAAELVEHGLWSSHGRGYRITAWAKHNALADDVRDVRKAKSAGGRRGNHNRWGHRGPFETCPKCQPSPSESHAIGMRSEGAIAPDSSEPEPEPETRDSDHAIATARARATDDAKAKTPKRRGKRPLPADWQPNASHRELAAEHGIDLDSQADRFRAYCQAHDKRYADHDAAFRNWLTSSYQQAQRASSDGQPERLTAAEQRSQRNRQNVANALAKQRQQGMP